MTRRSEASRGSEPISAMTRREALRIGLAATGASLVWGGCEATGRTVLAPQRDAGEDAQSEAREDDGALDEVLRRLHAREPKSRQGLSTHAPMAAEALCALGYSDRAVAWVERYGSRDVEIPSPRERIGPERWREVLGPRRGARSWETSLGRFGDWRVLFTEELAESRWQDVLDRWSARLAPGICAAATHGVIRTGHAVSALARRETPERRAELARGLAYWAAAYEELPARKGTGARVKTYAEALERLPSFWEACGVAPSGSIVDGLRQGTRVEGFADARDLVETPEDVSAALSSLSATFAREYLRHGTRHDTIAFVHAVTGPCALRRIAPHVKPETARAALPYAWQAAAAIHTSYARGSDEIVEPAPKLTAKELAARAVENGDEHAIKLTEVLLAEHALRPDPAYLAAAEDVVRRL